VAGNIGAKQLQHAAKALEMACKAGQDAGEIDALSHRVDDALAIVLRGIESLNDSPSR
jgi:HPt (histidine-containing phosphotransfer) domain-containing protein